MLKKILTTLCALSIGSGLFLAFGSAGASDFKTIFTMGGIGVALVWIGFMGLKFTNFVYFD